LSDPVAVTPSAGPRPKYKRKLANFLLDKKLQLRYVIVITLLSGMIAGALGVLIFDQQRRSTQSIEHDLEVLMSNTASDQQDVKNITGEYEDEDRKLVYKMIIAGMLLVIILSMFLVVMTHKVAGPLYKTSLYFDKMAEGRLGKVTPLRSGDMLQDFFTNFKDMHDTVRARSTSDVETMDKALASLRDAGNRDAKLVEELDRLEKHLLERKKNLA
jgi:hypothetical protein